MPRGERFLITKSELTLGRIALVRQAGQIEGLARSTEAKMKGKQNGI